MKYIAAIIFVLAIGISIGSRWPSSPSEGLKSAVSVGGKRARMICPMHPWVDSDETGKCMVCGMSLVSATRAMTDRGSGKHIRLGTYGAVAADIETSLISPQILTRKIRVSGWIRKNDARDRSIAAFVPGRIEKLFAQYEGVEIEKGMPLYSIYSPQLLEWEREYNLLYRQSQMNHSSRITAEHGRLLQAMRNRLIQYGLTDQQVNALPNKAENITVTDILSPADGLVVKHSVLEGQYVKEGDRILDVADQYGLWFEFDVYENDYPYVKVGQKVSLRVPGVNQRTVDGIISFINPDLNGKTRSTTARVDLQNPTIRIQGIKTRLWQLNTFAEASIDLERGPVMAVPRSAVLATGSGQVVFVETDPGIYERREFRVGFKGDESWEVMGGLEAATSVVTQGGVLLDSESRM